MATDSIVGAGLAQSPHAELHAEVERLRRELADARKALQKVGSALWHVGAAFRTIDDILVAEQAAQNTTTGDGGHTA